MGKRADAEPARQCPLCAARSMHAHVEKLLGKDFELKFERGISSAYHDSTEDIWDWYTRGFGPLRQLVQSLPPDRVHQLRRDVDAYHRHYAIPAGLHMKREYLITLGRRR